MTNGKDHIAVFKVLLDRTQNVLATCCFPSLLGLNIHGSSWYSALDSINTLDVVEPSK